jgi:hypothetical protein
LPFDNMLVMFFARLPGDRYQKPQKMAWNISNTSIVNNPANKSKIIKRWKMPVK